MISIRAPRSKRPLDKKDLGRSFYLLWTGQTISLFGSQITIIALPLIAIYVLQASNFAVGAVTAMYFLPHLLLGFQAGAYVDRWDKRSVLITCDLMRAGLFLLLAGGAVSGNLWMWSLYIIAFLHGSCNVFYDVAYASYLPELVKRDQLQDGNAKLELTRSASQVAGPGLGGYLVQAMGASLAVIADAVSYLLSSIALMLIPKTERERKNKESVRRQSIWADIKEGLVFVSNHRMLRAIMASYSLNVFFIGMYQSIYILYMTRSLGISAATLGIVFALGNCGFLAGAAISKRFSEKAGVGKSLISSLGLIALGFLITGSAPPSFAFPLLVLGQFVTGIGVPIYNVNIATLRQAITPQPLLGRVSSVSRVLGRGVIPLGALLGAGVSYLFGLRTAIILAGLGGLVALLPAILSGVATIKNIEDHPALDRIIP